MHKINVYVLPNKEEVVYVVASDTNGGYFLSRDTDQAFRFGDAEDACTVRDQLQTEHGKCRFKCARA